jgi:transcriptional regulator with XRE-family HTH domain
VQVFSGRKVRAARKNADMRQEQLALLIGRSFHALHLYECGRRNPPLVVLERMAAVLDVPISSFFEDEELVAQ